MVEASRGGLVRTRSDGALPEGDGGSGGNAASGGERRVLSGLECWDDFADKRASVAGGFRYATGEEARLYRVVSRASYSGGVVVDTPVAIVSQPQAVTVNEGSSFTLKVSASGTSPTYQWYRNGQLITSASGRSASYTVAAASASDGGTYVCVVGNTVGSVQSKPVSVSVTIPPKITLQPVAMSVVAGGNGALSVAATGTGTLHYQWRRNGVNLPNTDSATYRFVAVNGDAVGTYDCRITDDRGSVLSKPVTVSVRGSSFVGYVTRETSVNGNMGSMVTLSVDGKGACSVKVLTGATSVSGVGQLALASAGQALAKDLAALVDPLSVGQARLSMKLSNLGTLDVLFDPAAGTFSGTVGNGAKSAMVNGWRNAWAEVSGGAAKMVGTYHFALSQGNADAALPQGSGFGSLTVAQTTGAIVCSGSLADGVSFASNVGFVGQNGEVLLYAPLYANRGSLGGVVAIQPGKNAPLDNAMGGGVTWLKPAPLGTTQDTVYRAGFGPIPLTLTGSIYAAPGKGGRVMGLPASTSSNAQLLFSAGGLPANLSQPVLVANPSATGLSNTAVAVGGVNGVKITRFDAATGVFAGEFTPVGTTRKASFSGEIVSVNGRASGYGFFLLPKAPVAGETAATAPRLSGGVVLTDLGASGSTAAPSEVLQDTALSYRFSVATGGWRGGIDAVYRVGEEIVVSVVMQGPPPGAIVTQAFCYLTDTLTLRLPKLPIRYVTEVTDAIRAGQLLYQRPVDVPLKPITGGQGAPLLMKDLSPLQPAVNQ